MSHSGATLSADSSQRVRQALTDALLGAGVLPAQSGPWTVLIDESAGWRSRPQLQGELLRDLKRYFGSNLIREILLAAAGVKLSRTCLSDPKAEILREISERHGFSIALSPERYIHRRDSGKGGASNAIERIAASDEHGGLRNVYIGSDPALVETGATLEEAGDDENFGLLLGIPSCCREAFIRRGPIAAARQNDFVLLALEDTAGPMPYDFWLNYPAIYFGPALISFFPCSFRCEKAAAIAKSTYGMLRACDELWAASFLASHRTNILYTEYDGLHLFRRPLADGWIEYAPGDHEATEPGRLNDLISQCSRLEVCGKHKVRLWRGSEPAGALEGDWVGMFAFI